jgi:acyl carrier protein
LQNIGVLKIFLEGIMELLYNEIVSILEEKFGIIFLDDYCDDFSIKDYISDSIMYIQFIVFLEEKLGIEFPDEFLLPEFLDSAREFARMVDNYMKLQ